MTQWLKNNKGWAALGGIIIITGIASAAGGSAPAAATPVPQAAPTHNQATTQQTDSNLSNDNYYTNVNGNTVHSPAYTNNNSVPAGATAQCRDGSYSFSQNHSGTCSHHGGVETWY